MTPEDLDGLAERLVAKQEAVAARRTASRQEPKNGKGKLALAAAIVALAGGVTVLCTWGGDLASLFVMPRTEAATEHQTIKDLVTVEHTTNVVQDQQLITLDKNLTEMKDDIKSIGRRIGAKVK